MLRKKVICPLKYFEVEYTEEYKQLIQEGWKVESAAYNAAEASATFYMEKDET